MERGSIGRRRVRASRAEWLNVAHTAPPRAKGWTRPRPHFRFTQKNALAWPEADRGAGGRAQARPEGPAAYVSGGSQLLSPPRSFFGRGARPAAPALAITASATSRLAPGGDWALSGPLKPAWGGPGERWGAAGHGCAEVACEACCKRGSLLQRARTRRPTHLGGGGGAACVCVRDPGGEAGWCGFAYLEIDPGRVSTHGAERGG